MPAPEPLIAAVAQLCSRQDVADNVETAARLVREAAGRGAQLVVLPENFPYIGSLKQKAAQAEPLCAESPGLVLGAMIAAAREHSVHLLLGGIPILSDEPLRFHNTAILLDPEGAILATYRKIHLFDIDIADGPRMLESEYVIGGSDVVTAEVLGLTLGLSICYDLRFPELYRQLARRGAQICAVPAAFTLHTGKDHWLPLLRARAIENQFYVLAAGQHGRHTSQRTSYGKSCIIDPWGAVLAQCPDTDSVAVAKLDFSYLERIRRELPALTHVRMLGGE